MSVVTIDLFTATTTTILGCTARVSKRSRYEAGPSSSNPPFTSNLKPQDLPILNNRRSHHQAPRVQKMQNLLDHVNNELEEN